MSDAMGGYFGLERAPAAHPLPWLRDAMRFQSGRAAIAAVFLANGARAAWVPWFVCGAVRDALAHAGVEVRGYALDPGRAVPETVVLGPDEWLVCVDYFGASGAACDAAIARYGAERIVVDASQALLHAPRPGVATVYSPRKSCGVPDGGLLVNAPYVAPPAAADEMASVERARALLMRSGGLVEAGYQRFLDGEQSLADCTPQAMSVLTAGLLASVDVAHLRAQRIANYARLADLLGDRVAPLGEGDVPLCCPVAAPDAPRLRAALAARRIFTPGYWPDAAVPEHDGVGMALRHGTLYLPCDQRYGPDDMDRIARNLRELEESA